MQADNPPSILLTFPEYRDSAQRVAAGAGIKCAEIEVHRFPDGESRIRLPERLPADVAVFTSLNDPNRRLVELELAAAAALELGAARLTLVAPYLCYMRQDIAFNPGEAVSQRIIGAFLARRFDTLVTVDPHLHRTARLEDAMPVKHAISLTAAPVMAEWLKSQADDPLLIGPDAESEQWVRAIATLSDIDYGVAHKHRLGDADVRITLPDCGVKGRHVILVDDVASTGGTLLGAARQLLDRGAASVSVVVTHALFVGDAYQNLLAAGVSQVCSTNSVPHESNRLSLDGMLAEAIGSGATGSG